MPSATETQIMTDIRANHMRHVAARFLNETKALHLERDLTEFLIKIDRHHQEEIRQLKLVIESSAEIIKRCD